MDRGFEDIAFVVLVDTCAVADRLVGDVLEEAAPDDALYVGLECARKAARKLAKNGLFVGMAQIWVPS